MNTAKEIIQRFNAFKASDTMPHACLFIGGESQTQLVADELMAHILGKAIQIDSLKYNCKEQGSIDSIRDILRAAALLPLRAKRKIVLLEHVHAGSAQVMNALLKTLEEPPHHTIFILTSVRPVLSTIMSRCQVFQVSSQEKEILLESDFAETIALFEKNMHAGVAERIALVSTLANADDAILIGAIQYWMRKQVQLLNATPHLFPAVRTSMQTLQSLQGNFNKKMVLQNFVLHGLS